MGSALGETMQRLTRLRIQQRFAGKQLKQFEADIELMNSLVDGIIAERRQTPAESDDLLNLMLTAVDAETGEALDDVNIRYQVLTFLIAGHETTSGLLTFAFHLLLRHPHVLALAYAEADRVLPGDTIDSVEAHLRKQLGDDEIKIKRYPGNSEASPVSPTDSAGYRTIERSVRQSFPDAIVAPGLMTAATDSRHFSILSDAVFRFSPFRMKNEDLARFHGTNERLAISNYGEMIGFYQQLLRNASGAQSQ